MSGNVSGHAPAESGETLLAVSAVSKHFGGVRAVEDVSLEVRRGGIASIIGPNGAGKTSLLNMISGFYRPDTGSHLRSKAATLPRRGRAGSPHSASPGPSRTSRCSAA